MNRNLKFDFLKGLLMFGVIWGHLITCLLNNEPNDVSIHWMMRTYDMPFFMLISGYFLASGLQRKSIKQMVLDKVTTIMLPTILWSVLCSMFRAWDMFYFLWAVFYSSIFLALCQCIRNEKVRLAVHILIAFVLSCIPYKFYNMSYLYPFFVMGYWYFTLVKLHPNKFILQLKGGGFVTTCTIVLFVASLCFWEYDYSIWNVDGYIIDADARKYLIIAFRILIGILGIFVVKKLADIFFDYMQEHNNWFYRLILKAGQETMMIYIFQNALIFQIGVKVVALICNHLGYNPFSLSHAFMGYVLSPVLTTVMLYVLLAIIRFAKNYRFTSKAFGFKISLRGE